MDARSKANFINSIASGQIPCPQCNTLNSPDSKFCITCGKNLREEAPPAAAFAPAPETEPAPAQSPISTPAPVIEKVEEVSAFAQGLPEWSIEPPQVMVRRRRI